MKLPAKRGFTLIELGVVLAVTAILAAAIVPDFIETSRNKMVQKAATDVALIHDAARWFYAGSYAAKGALKAENSGRWPGQKNESACENHDPRDGLREMVTLHYLTNFPINPWGKPYEVQVRKYSDLPAPQPTIYGGKEWGCSFEVGTDVPQQVTSAFKAFLPNARCNDAAGNPCYSPTAPKPNYVRCCAFAPPPGAGWCPPGTRPKPTTAGLACCAAGSPPPCP